MTPKSFLKTLEMITKIYIRDISGPFFSVIFPIGMVLVFGGIYGNEPSPLFEYRHGAMDAMIPGLIGMIIAVNGVMTLPLNLSEYMTNKVYKRFDATPMGKDNIVVVQLIVYVLATFVSAAIIIIFGKILHNINILGGWHLIILAILLSSASMFAIGFFVASIFKDGKHAQIMSYVIYFLMIFLSGATIPLEIFPEGMRTIANTLPLTHAVTFLQNVFGGQDIRYQVTEILILFGVVAACLSIGIWSYKRRKWA